MKNDRCSEESPQFRTQGFRRFPVAIFGYLTIGADPDRMQHIPFCHFEMECQIITDCITGCTKGRAVAFHLMPAICCCSTEGAAPHNTQRLFVVFVGIGCIWWFGVVALGTSKCPQNGVALGHVTTKSQAAIAAAKNTGSEFPTFGFYLPTWISLARKRCLSTLFILTPPSKQGFTSVVYTPDEADLQACSCPSFVGLLPTSKP